VLVGEGERIQTSLAIPLQDNDRGNGRLTPTIVVRFVVELHRAAESRQGVRRIRFSRTGRSDDYGPAAWRVLILPKDASERPVGALDDLEKARVTAVARTVRAVPVPVSASSLKPQH